VEPAWSLVLCSILVACFSEERLATERSRLEISLKQGVLLLVEKVSEIRSRLLAVIF